MCGGIVPTKTQISEVRIMLPLRPAALIALSIALSPAIAHAQWNGLYIGGTGTLTPGDFSDSFGPGEQLSGGMLGAQIGYRLQFGPAVLGVEADYLFGETGYSSPARAVVIDQLGTVRANMGLPVGPLLAYGTAGVAVGRARVEDSFGPAALLDEHSHFGLTIGGGLELPVTDSLSVRGEYQYMRFGEQSYDVSTPNYQLDYQVHSIRAGLNFNF